MRKNLRLDMGLFPLLVVGLVVVERLSPDTFNVGFSLSAVDALAAKNKGRRRQSSGSAKGNGGFGGFGTPPPSLDDFLATVKANRTPKDASSVACPCGKTKVGQDQKVIKETYAECCAPLLENNSLRGDCRTPLQVLQSRYTAFCFRNIGHVIRTTHEECRDYQDDKVAWAKDLDKQGMFDSFEFVELEILEEDGKDGENNDENEAFLDFKVRLRGRSLEDVPTRSRSLSSVEGEETVISERSKFLRDPESGVWTYAGGDVRSSVQGLEDVSLNA